ITPLHFCKPFRLQHEKYPKGARVGFKLRAFRQDFYLHLTPDSTFLATGGGSAASRASSGLRECFYSGDVNADPDSFVAVSLCKGLRGGFTHKAMEYIITASTEDTAAEYGHILEKTHRINRRMSSRHPGANFPSRCGVTPDTNFSRSVSIPRFVEVMVVADQSMAAFHGVDLEHYLLTLMSVAARLYKHPSILNSINIVVVGFMVINETDKGPKVSSNAALTLRNFCSWQKKLNKPNDKHPEYWDTAILFTKQVATTCDTLGMADVGTICDPKRSCSVIEDDGLPSAFTTAHELGKIVGCCLSFSDNRSIMGPYCIFLLYLSKGTSKPKCYWSVYFYLVAWRFFCKLKMNERSLIPLVVLSAIVWIPAELFTVCAVLAGQRMADICCSY
uniref:Peptidase M12B domain-containing protein n=1 Tax=Xiphophorus maculatus TaxID=8083 RepID=A0A3B5RDL3_XIPMA